MKTSKPSKPSWSIRPGSEGNRSLKRLAQLSTARPPSETFVVASRGQPARLKVTRSNAVRKRRKCLSSAETFAVDPPSASSPTLVAEYQTMLPPKAVLRRKLHELYTELASGDSRDVESGPWSEIRLPSGLTGVRCPEVGPRCFDLA